MFSAPEEEREEDINTKGKEKRQGGVSKGGEVWVVQKKKLYKKGCFPQRKKGKII